jgi:lysophospholipase L1-like esterase
VAIPQPEWPRSPTGQGFGEPTATLNRVRVFNTILREEVQRVGGQWQDLGPLMSTQADRAMWAPDGLHPSAEAYDQWAEALARAYASPPRS